MAIYLEQSQDMHWKTHALGQLDRGPLEISATLDIGAQESQNSENVTCPNVGVLDMSS
jgi:hypothetical protein